MVRWTGGDTAAIRFATACSYHGFNTEREYIYSVLRLELKSMPACSCCRSSDFCLRIDARITGTVAAIERDLLADGFVRRYRTHEDVDGLPPGEGVFLLCSFWLADNYVLQNRMDDALRLFEKLLALQNDLGLLSEEYDPHARRLLGNFPQAFSHVSLN